jgi:effector-binding domain-containing protein
MRYAVRTSQAGPRVLAAARATTTRQHLGTDIVRLLDMIWPALRAEGARTGHNVVVYYGGGADGLDIAAGVEVFSDFAGHGEIQRISTPSGEAAATTHFGEYSDLGGAYAALEQWCTSNGRRAAGVNWEVYGDWDDDPARRQTDVYFLLEPAPR